MSQEISPTTLGNFLTNSEQFDIDPYARDKDAEITTKEIVDEAIEIDQEAQAVLGDWNMKMPPYVGNAMSRLDFGPTLQLRNSSRFCDQERLFATTAITDTGIYWSSIEGEEFTLSSQPNGLRRYRRYATIGYRPSEESRSEALLDTHTNHGKTGKLMVANFSDDIDPDSSIGGTLRTTRVGNSRAMIEGERVTMPTPAARMFKQVIFKAIRECLADAERLGPVSN